MSFTGDGLLLRAQVPNNELLTSLVMTAAMISREAAEAALVQLRQVGLDAPAEIADARDLGNYELID